MNETTTMNEPNPESTSGHSTFDCDQWNRRQEAIAVLRQSIKIALLEAAARDLREHGTAKTQLAEYEALCRAEAMG